MANESNSSGKSVFEQIASVQPCSWAQCAAGHQWVPTLALVPCEGCKAQALMVKMENCPFCNEPTTKVGLRTDHIPSGAGVAKRCQGQQPPGESVDVVMERSGWKRFEIKEVESGKSEEISG